MNRFSAILALVSAILFVPMISSVFAQTESINYKISHIKTIEQKQGDDYYSYNFAVSPVDITIDRIKIAVISDLETRYSQTERDVSPPDLISFGVMIHAIDPDKIKYKVIEIITK